MENAIQYFKENSNWIKDLFTLIFTGTATILAVLTYRRAKATVLQPKRTEVIKIQAQVLTDFLKSISENGNSINSSLDYLSVMNCNVYFNMLKSGFAIEEEPEIYNSMKSIIAGCYARFQNKSNITQLKGNLDELLSFVKMQETTSLVVLTKQALDTINLIIELKNNPFIPDEINEIIDEIKNELTYNYFELMPSYCNPLTKITQNKNSNFMSDFEEFDRKRKKHDESIEKLKQKIRQHLGINDKW